MLGGRGAGKTRAGAEWVRAQVEGAKPEDLGRCQRVALVGETFDQARDVMVFGDSGILACTPPDRRPTWEASRRRLVWPNGAEAKVYSGTSFEGLRGPQFDAAWVDEIGCAAIDKGTNEPNKFLDPKSSESSLPKYSNGARDDLIQMQYLRAMSEFWSDPANNPVSTVYGAEMVAPDRMYVWAWDARPYPFFPGNTDVWSDGENYARGHWLNGRATARHLDGLLTELCAEAAVFDVDVGEVYGLVRGFVLDGSETARAAIQPLLLAFGIDAIERDGKVVFRSRGGRIDHVLEAQDLAEGEAGSSVARTRAPEAEVSGRVRLGFVEADGDYETRGTEAIFPDEATTGVSRSEMSLALSGGEAQGIVERWLAEARVARDAASFALPPSSKVSTGDIVELDGELLRIDRMQEAGLKQVEAVRVERNLYQATPSETVPNLPAPVVPPLPVWSTLLDLPLISGAELPDAPWIAATAAEAWPGSVAVYSSLDGNSWTYEAELVRRAVMGQTVSDLRFGAHGLARRTGSGRSRVRCAWLDR